MSCRIHLIQFAKKIATNLPAEVESTNQPAVLE
jgi:hypothetical protein